MSQDNFYEKHFLSSLDWLGKLVADIVHEEMKKHQDEEIERTKSYYENERKILQKASDKLYKYITSGGELKDGITVVHANKVIELEKEITSLKKRLDKNEHNLAKR